MTLIDKYLRDSDFKEIHHIEIPSTKKACYAATRKLDLSKTKLIVFLFWLRGLPISELSFEGFTRNMKFTFLEEIPDEEFVYGFWLKNKVEWILDKDEFINGGTGYNAKVVWQFIVKRLENGDCRISTETRIKCLSKKARISFGIYWFFIQPFSALVRILLLRQIKHDLAIQNAQI